MKKNLHKCEDGDCTVWFNIHATDERSGEISHIHYETLDGVTFLASGVTVDGKKVCSDCHEKQKKEKRGKQ